MQSYPQASLPLAPRGSWEALPLPDADVSLCQAWMDHAEADSLLAELLEVVPWETHRIRIFGREVASPRLSCWIGDPDATYVYSRTRFEPHPWPASLIHLRERIASACGMRFNSVLANLYRDGDDAMGWHSDDEPELGRRPVIASLSLGVARRFRLRRRKSPDSPADPGCAVMLDHGSLLRMAGDTQQNYQHALPRTRSVVAPRLNLTFRYIHARR